MMIEELFAFIVLEREGEEGVPAFASGNMLFPLMGSDWTRVESLRPIAQRIARASGKPVTLCKFSVREDVEVIAP